MNRTTRVLIVTRRFWPHGGHDSAAALLALATGLHRQGVHVEVLAPRFASSWPDEFSLREFTVHRPAAAPRSDWSMARYARHVTSWLRERVGGFDLVYCDAIREEAICVVDATRGTRVANLLRLEGWGDFGNVHWWSSSRSAQRCQNALRQCDGVIAKNAAEHRELVARGVPSSKVHRVDNGFAPGQVRSALSRSVARKVLAQVNSDLSAEIQAPVILCIGRMLRGDAMELLADSVRTIVARYPEARVWFVGDGPNRESLYTRMRSDGVRVSIAMPGTFLDFEDLYAAADVFVQLDEDGLDHFLPGAVSAELPIVAVKNDSVRAVIGGNFEIENGITWFEPGQTKSLCQAIRTVLDDMPQARLNAANVRRALLRSRPQRATIDAHIELMRRLIDIKSDPQSRSSVEVAS